MVSKRRGTFVSPVSEGQLKNTLFHNGDEPAKQITLRVESNIICIVKVKITCFKPDAGSDESWTIEGTATSIERAPGVLTTKFSLPKTGPVVIHCRTDTCQGHIEFLG